MLTNSNFNMTKSYEHQPAFQSGRLPVGDIHVLHYEQYGKPDGKPGTPKTPQLAEWMSLT
jgi:hypothetical protein